jgi:phospholipase A1/A2
MTHKLTISNLIVGLLAFFMLIGTTIDTKAQVLNYKGEVINTDSLHRDFDHAPWFGLYKDNYFVFGPSIGQKATKYNTNVKFQISIAQRLTKSTLPFGTYLYLFYTQKCIWNVLEESLPMKDLNFNPGIGLAKPIIRKDGRFIGVLQLAIEHESNGRDSIESRSWNRISFGGSVMITPSVTLHGKVWVALVDGENNKDLLKYTGICQAGISYNSPNKRFGAAMTITKRENWKLDFNTTLELNYRIFRSSNQYLFLQYYNGYGENLLDYNQFRSQIRVGLVIKPALFSSY